MPTEPLPPPTPDKTPPPNRIPDTPYDHDELGAE